MHTILDLYARVKEMFNCGNFRGRVKSKEIDESLIFTIKRRRIEVPKLNIFQSGSHLVTPHNDYSYYYFDDRRKKRSLQTELIKHSLNFDSNINSRMEVVKNLMGKKGKKKRGKTSQSSVIESSELKTNSEMEVEICLDGEGDGHSTIPDEYEDLLHFVTSKKEEKNFPILDYEQYKDYMK